MRCTDIYMLSTTTYHWGAGACYSPEGRVTSLLSEGDNVDELVRWLEPFMELLTLTCMDMEWVSGGYGYFLGEKFWSGVGNGVKYQNVCMKLTALILSLQYETMAHLYVEHNINGFAKFNDVGENGEISTKNGYGWKWIIVYKKKSGYGCISICLNGVEWSGSQNFAPWRAMTGAATDADHHLHPVQRWETCPSNTLAQKLGTWPSSLWRSPCRLLRFVVSFSWWVPNTLYLFA